ncbi:putative type II restriction endonuclease [Helicobacter heilmannii]|uniref:Putative type II restriction endonuclease n=1 Tax=Helicobacter heilmannii TaxID=35817 RepID=A0A0K2XVX0_HELHE|nr:HNH endonuclease [Helicobacter heilmannii]CCM11969.1 putative type II restriction endonuclease [Helicobacter heilmannii ASB1.4]CRF49863.1 putative type II restriction endonuclease [Helicobacter heilmannii]CRF50783.1 putative type II restriction endonuclease [Helicobacter heilmannii]CRI34397.1 putative type II restriction endonuclease [Helicobacter heilmannii]BDQ27021.1 hypothetical protein ASB1_06970 [Helicobacter heilmannii]
MRVGNINYKILDVLENITLADSFIKGGNKIGSGHGEAKLYVGQTADKRTLAFFDLQDNPNKIIPCFILKKDLLQYLQDTTQEYQNPTQAYKNKASMPTLWQSRVAQINSLQDVLHFNLRYLHALRPPRVYLNTTATKDENYSLLREVALPNLSYLSCLKLKNTANGAVVFYFKIFANLDFLQQELTTLQETRSGQAAYRRALLQECPFCPITMLNYDRLLIASHIKPFAHCQPHEQYDPKNGLMLTPTIDKLFDKGFISFKDNKEILLSPWLSTHTFSCLHLKAGKKYPSLPFDAQRLVYLRYHRERIFKA